MADQTKGSSRGSKDKYRASTSEQKLDEAQQQQQKPAVATGQQLDFVVRPRFGNRFHIQPIGPNGQPQSKRETVSLSNVYTKICNPSTQAEALRQLGIQLLSKTRVKLDLQEFPPNFTKYQHNQSHPSVDSHLSTESVELRATFSTRNPIIQPMDIQANYIKDAYIEGDTAFCCLLETNSPYGDRNAVPVLGRGSFSYLASSSIDKAAALTAAQREHCISGPTASFLQRAALSLTTLLCLCELSKEDDKMVIDFYRDVDQSFGYGFAPYLDYLVYCCQTSIQHRDPFLKYLCLEWNNKFTQDRMTLALTHFIETRQPTQRYFEEVPSVMSQEELERDRKLHHSIKGKAVKASMFLKNAGKEHMGCCPCHLM